jgi:hypothetical protein
MKLKPANPAHEVAFQDLNALLAKHADEMTAEEMLAVAANLVGKLIALQDQRTMTPDRAMAIVARNIEIGNAQAIETVMDTKGSA